LKAVLSRLGADSKNEIWMVTNEPVNKIEWLQGEIKDLNLAGRNGKEFSELNKNFVDLPDVALLAEEASAGPRKTPTIHTYVNIGKNPFWIHDF
jgi:trehalose-6-phosphatase